MSEGGAANGATRSSPALGGLSPALPRCPGSSVLERPGTEPVSRPRQHKHALRQRALHRPWSLTPAHPLSRSVLAVL